MNSLNFAKLKYERYFETAMPKFRRHIGPPNATRAITLIQEGHSQHYVALQLGFSRRTTRMFGIDFKRLITKRAVSGRIRENTPLHA